MDWKTAQPGAGFATGRWQERVDVRDFIYTNLTPYEGDASFMAGPTGATEALWDRCRELLEQERERGGVLAVDPHTIATITSHPPGYIDRGLERIVGLQTDAPLKRAIKPFGGWRVVQKACQEAGYELDPAVIDLCKNYRKTHNDGVFDAYAEENKLLRKSGIITGLPDNYGRGRIIGDYRRLALYGADALMEAKEEDKKALTGTMTEERIRLREEISEQIRALEMVKEMAAAYGFDVGRPAQNAREAIQWTYFAYLASIKEQDGAAMSLGNVNTFFDIYIERDLQAGVLSEEEAQELIDHFVMKLRLIRHLRTGEYNQLFAGDPTWVTESIGGIFRDGQHKITKTAFRMLQTLYNLGPGPEPNLTVLWSPDLPEGFKRYCARVSIDTSSVQYENDALMSEAGACDDYCVACCVSMMETGKEMQFFGARCNLAKTLLLALNEGRDEVSGVQIVPGIAPLPEGPLEYEEVRRRFEQAMAFVAQSYVNTMNIIHFMHDKYYYERGMMAFMDSVPKRNMAFGIAGLSVTADSLSAVRHARVFPQRNEQGLTVDFRIEGEFPKFGNDDDRVDSLAVDLVRRFNEELGRHPIYRDATPTLSVLTITSNVVYGKKTGATPDGRKAGEPFAPGANPMHGRDTSGAVASLSSVAKLSYMDARDGISNTFSLVPQSLGSTQEERERNLTALLDGYFEKGAHHLNVNVLNRETLLKAMQHPEKYPQLTIRVSGYAVNFTRLSREHQQEVLARTFHEAL